MLTNHTIPMSTPKLHTSAAQVIRVHVDELKLIRDELEEPYRIDNIRNLVGFGPAKRFANEGILQKDDRVIGDDGDPFYLWSMHRRAHRYLDNLSRPELPCGHRWGIVQISENEFTCPADNCNSTYTKQQIKQHAPTN